MESLSPAALASTITAADRPVVVEFWTPWCAPCRALAPKYELLAARRDDAIFVKVNADEAPDVAARYQVMSFPTVLVLAPQTGEILGEVRGGVTVRAIEAKLDQVLGV